jgi:CDP-glucose 4,6-dehydratase
MAADLAAFYRGKRVLVTGHTGFQGGWLVTWLKLLGAQVCGYGLPPSRRPNFFDAVFVDRGITSMFADGRDRNALANAFTEFQPEIVVHCATQANSELALSDPVQTFTTNLLGTVHLLEEARQTASVRAVIVSTHSVPRRQSRWFWGYGQESFGASEPFSSSFAAAELAAAAYIDCFFAHTNTAVGVARTSELLGGGDWSEARLIPQMVRAIISNQEVVISDQWCAIEHVLDAVYAFLLLARKLYDGGQRYSGAWNFAPANLLKKATIANQFAEAWGELDIKISAEKTGGCVEPGAALSTATTESQLESKPVLSIEEAIAWTAQWYRSYYAEPSSAVCLTERQIELFTNKAANAQAPHPAETI